MIRIALSGCLGKMGKSVLTEIKKKNDMVCTVGLVSKQGLSTEKNTKYILNIKEKNIKICTSLIGMDKFFDVLIDFSSSKKSIENLRLCCKYKKNAVIGTTGFSFDEQNEICSISKKIGIVQSSNFSVGINLMLKLLNIATQTMWKNSDIEIVEEHHREKRDAPSGTALSLGKEISDVMKCKLKDVSVLSRVGNIGIRKKKSIGFSVIRAGQIIGNHKVIFANKNEHIVIKHKAIDRSIFSKGAIKAAKWIFEKERGLFSMKNVLNF